MNVPFTYEEMPVPAGSTQYIRRIMVANHEGDNAVTIPARPTGQCYIGWVPMGHATARANDATFSIDPSQYHLSGQLTTFEADYTLHGPATHFLAECTPTGAFCLAHRDLGTLRNKIEMKPFERAKVRLESAFAAFLETLVNSAQPDDDEIARAAEMIEQANGNIGIADLAKELGLGDRQLHRQFTKVVGMPPKAFAMVKRVLFALQKLATEPDADIADVAVETGFTDQAHLTKYFNLYMRTTPAKLELNDDGVLKSVVAKL